MARPNLSYLKSLIVFLVGLPVGMLTGLTAMGSSVILTPGLRWLLGLRPGRAGATALAATAFAAFAGLLSYAQHGDIRWGLALMLTVGQIVGAGWGTHLVTRLPALVRLHLLWAILVLAGGLALLAQGTHVLAGQPWATPLGGMVLWLAALGVAVLVGLISRVVELGGVLLVPAAVELLRLPPHIAQGTALVVLLLAALPGMLIYARRGDLEPQATVWLSVGGVFGALAGAFWASRIRSDDALLTLFGLALTLIGVIMVFRRDPATAAA